MKRIIRFILTLRRYSKKFGFITGIQLYFKLKFNNTDNISLKNLYYPFSLRSGTSDISIFHQIFANREYDFNLYFVPKIIIDAGANIGLASIFYANKYPNSKIISIEPERSNYNLLKKNTQKYSNIISLNNALSNLSNENLSIIDKGFGYWGFMTEPEANGIKSKIPSVKSVSIDEIMSKYGYEIIDIVKIDIEGYEKEVFEKNSENWLPKTRCLIIELHDNMKEGCSKSVFSAIIKHDFSFSHRGENLIFINNKLRAIYRNMSSLPDSALIPGLE